MISGGISNYRARASSGFVFISIFIFQAIYSAGAGWGRRKEITLQAYTVRWGSAHGTQQKSSGVNVLARGDAGGVCNLNPLPLSGWCGFESGIPQRVRLLTRLVSVPEVSIVVAGKPATKTTAQEARPGGRGAKRSRARIRTRELANWLVDKPSNPLIVMYRNLRHWDKEAQRLQAALEALDPTLLADDPEEQRNAFKTLAAHLHAREMSQRCAVDLAPYLHPRLAAIQWSPTTDAKPAAITGDMTPAQAAEAYANSLKQLEPPK